MTLKKIEDSPDPRSQTPISLSTYFPQGTEYFYGYPAEEDSHFFNGVAPEVEELVAARPLTCAGPNVKTVCFQAALEPFVWGLMEDLGVLKLQRSDVIALPKEIDTTVRGAERNQMVKQALVDLTHEGKLLMAQPFLDPRLKHKYLLPSHRIIWFNDKRNVPSYIPWQYIERRYDEFLDGECFKEAVDQVLLPCVIKVSSSSSGDGVRICNTEADVEQAKADFSRLEGIILITELVDMKRNFGVQFGIPENDDEPIEIIRCHEQLTDKKGSFIGGIIEQQKKLSILKPMAKVIHEKILPEVRRKGWFGVGGFDVLMSKDERFYIVDPNFRMTGMTAYDLLARNGSITKSLLSFMGTFSGTQQEFKQRMEKIAKVGSPNQRLYLTTLTQHDDIFRFNAALLFDERREIPSIAQELLDYGVQSHLLKGLTEGTAIEMGDDE